MAELVKPGFRLLMVDDSEDDVFLVKNALNASGVGQFFFSVPDGKEAIAYLRAEGKYADRQQFPFPNALLLDLHMPHTNGFDVLRWLSQHPECRVIPTIVFTSSPMEDDIHQAYVLGANAFITKPNSYEGLVKVIQTTYDFWSRCQIPRPPPGDKCG